MVARPYLRTPRTKIVQTAHLVQRKRHELVAAITKGLVPPDTSPAAKKKKNFRIDVRLSQAMKYLVQYCSHSVSTQYICCAAVLSDEFLCI